MTNKAVRGAPFNCQEAFDEFVAYRRTSVSIRVIRAFFDLTQAELARNLGVSRKTVVAMERGLVIPSSETVKKLDNFYAARGASIEADDLKLTFVFASL
ncbi:MAG: helix-turn-helix transcriptional regulator [Candidatus Pacebacteria bacterium]|nr:helix-turn-helix transcriptional regulator [Candidatus Paceibacterota bacterium]